MVAFAATFESAALTWRPKTCGGSSGAATFVSWLSDFKGGARLLWNKICPRIRQGPSPGRLMLVAFDEFSGDLGAVGAAVGAEFVFDLAQMRTTLSRLGEVLVLARHGLPFEVRVLQESRGGSASSCWRRVSDPLPPPTTTTKRRRILLNLALIHI